ncbi:hypothetical protein DFH07DRAFT_798750 [Mycena maculata]|uniref:Uncharacterized protein n=1 Tax=Mycena maculata TaxID=230809 RepID=A0AAD7K3Z3_9AGAR|nr:hypothetical protein DFH07DRAFT_798750 [Mycena maculata]
MECGRRRSRSTISSTGSMGVSVNLLLRGPGVERPEVPYRGFAAAYHRSPLEAPQPPIVIPQPYEPSDPGPESSFWRSLFRDQSKRTAPPVRPTPGASCLHPVRTISTFRACTETVLLGNCSTSESGRRENTTRVQNSRLFLAIIKFDAELSRIAV